MHNFNPSAPLRKLLRTHQRRPRNLLEQACFASLVPLIVSLMACAAPAADEAASERGVHFVGLAPLHVAEFGALAENAALRGGTLNVDSDDDGVNDDRDVAPSNPYRCRDLDNDQCDDCSQTGPDRSGGDEDNDGEDNDGDGACDIGDDDDDDDGVPDGEDEAPTDPAACSDQDNDGCDDCTRTGPQGDGADPRNDGPDFDNDGSCDIGDPDDDNDGVPDGEDAAPKNPRSCRDLDNDGCNDCSRTGADQSGGDTFNDGNDFDGDEQCDSGDTDDDNDGSEDNDDWNDFNPNLCSDTDADTCDDCSSGRYAPANDGVDTDADASCDDGDVDDDNDGLRDEDEGGATADDDGDGVPNRKDLDSDNDGLSDAVEAGHGLAGGDGFVACASGNGSNGLCDALETSGDSGASNYIIRDTDGDTRPDFVDIDSDNDGACDLAESGGDGLDPDNDHRIDDATDEDGDGIRAPGDDDDTVFGYPMLAPSNFDSDGDSIPDAFDTADDGDAAGDSNRDGVSDNVQCEDPPGWPFCPDDDGDGQPDYMEFTDSDRDGVSDGDDLDLDGDGLPSALENMFGIAPYGDADGDNVPNYLDTDNRGDGVANACADALAPFGRCDAPPRIFDEDGDGVPNHQDLDSDGDGILDATEAGHRASDADGDGMVDGRSGQNGLLDALETLPESGFLRYAVLHTDRELPGGDDIPDFLDLDSDADGRFDIDEVATLARFDRNFDGRIDDRTDADEDGLPDESIDANAARYGMPSGATNPRPDDLDGDGIPDAYDGHVPGAFMSSDTDSDIRPDALECIGGWPCPDAGQDGTPNYADANDTDRDAFGDGEDIDADGDGIPDKLENQLGLDPEADGDGDGLANFYDNGDRGDGAAGDCPDEDGNGICDLFSTLYDRDGDRLPNHLDSDADGDLVLDLYEAGHERGDEDGDWYTDGAVGQNGLSDDLEAGVDSGAIAYALRDSDGDGVMDFLDDDSDGDTISDLHEGTDGTPGSAPLDTDGDATPDMRDHDTDSDGISDFDESGENSMTLGPVDTDNDGTPDFRDLDADGDGVSDEVEAGANPDAPADTDSDGEPDFQDIDSDDDSIKDGVDNCRLLPNRDQVDSDGDGQGDVCDATPGNGSAGFYGVQGGGGGCSAAGDARRGELLLLLAALLLPLVLRPARRDRRPRPRRLLRTRHGATLLGALLLLAASAPPAAAQIAEVSSSFSLERFRLATDSAGILDVEGARVGAPLSLDFGLWLGYADDPLNVYFRMDEDAERERVGALVSRRSGGALSGAVALWYGLQLGIVLDVVVYQEQDAAMLMGGDSLSSFGVSAMNFVPKYQLLSQDSHGFDVAVAAAFTVPVQSSDDYFADRGLSFRPALMIGRDITPRLRGGVDLGYHSRKRQESLDLEIDDEAFARAGLGYSITEEIELTSTLAMATRARDFFSSFNENYSELKGGMNYQMGRVTTFAAAGLGIQEGFGTPDWRVLAGVRVGPPREPAPAPLPPAPAPEPEPAPLDSDGDGILDADDACPEEAETFNQFEDSDGCPDELLDSDGDNIFDHLDECPTVAEDLDGFMDEDGCPDADNDGDGVLDQADGCMNEAGPIENRGCPDADRDGDTIVDRLDNCPDEAGPVENQGCVKEQLVQITDNQIIILDRVYFETDKARIRSRSFALLNNVVQVLEAHPEIANVRIEGHTDDRGSDAYNLDLSDRRAASVVSFLIEAGVDPVRLQSVGYGETRPVRENGSREGRAANRRVEFHIVRDAEPARGAVP
ncbi:OmpA/MotB domain protein [Haliangium ochraceum DSM 14365]|uniref:OmpA/MotB domain protein n=1 Tax=Haliangium ochraceum (strain DSM 14365 / JCM 11303 / SMP-2) TaxID=502025 RepID=D0LST0_HALO1|nr:OmpA/MotB domain protein [Haliangium ochraceum DSM 14365]